MLIIRIVVMTPTDRSRKMKEIYEKLSKLSWLDPKQCKGGM